MKIDRRSFLALGVGATAGITLSPLPWKLTDDLSIWTQRWPWTPVPERGESSYVNSVCTLCPGGCGISVRKIDARPIKIEGMPGYPGNDGNACPLGLSGLQLLYGPTAIKTPLKRVGERGEGKWQKISWDEAISQVVSRLGNLRKSGRPQALACITEDDEGSVTELFKRFFISFGSPNLMYMPSYEDGYELTFSFMHGAGARVGFDIENSDFVLSFGSGIIEGWGMAPRMIAAKSILKDKKAKVVQIEPRLSNTAAKADRWIPINPGTEAVLALGMAGVIIEQGLYDKKFTGNYSTGFEDWKDAKGKEHKGFKSLITENYGLGYVSRVTGVDGDIIRKLAKEFAKSSRPLAIFGRGQGKTPGSIHEFMAVHALNALVGNINRKGGVWAVKKADYIKWDSPALDDTAKKGLMTDRVDGAGKGKYKYANSLLTRFPGVIASAAKSPVEILFVAGGNPYYCLPGSATVKKAFEKIPFIVSFASHMDETAMMADIILPSPGHLERYQDVPAASGMNRPVVGLSIPVVPPSRDARYPGDALILMAKALGGSVKDAFPWENYEACLAEIFGDKWDELKEKVFTEEKNFAPEPWDKAFKTPDKKFAFLSENCKHDKASDIHKAGVQGDEKKFPLVLIPYDTLRIATGPVSDTPFVMKIIDDTMLLGKDSVVEINPKTGGKLGLADGVYANITTPLGSARVKVCFSDGIIPGVMAIPRGLGHHGIDEYMAGKGVNVNQLIGPVEDPASGLDAAWGIRANLTIA